MLVIASGNPSAPSSTTAGAIVLSVATNTVKIVAATGTSVVGAAVTVATSTFK